RNDVRQPHRTFRTHQPVWRLASTNASAAARAWVARRGFSAAPAETRRLAYPTAVKMRAPDEASSRSAALRHHAAAIALLLQVRSRDRQLRVRLASLRQ